MTSLQFHYPFFLDIEALNVELLPYLWIAKIVETGTKDHSAYLSVIRISKEDHSRQDQHKIEIGFHETLMVQDNRLYCWLKYEDGLAVRQFQLKDEDPNATVLSEFIETLSLDPGKHEHQTKLTYDHFVTFIRKGNLERKEDYHEHYVIIHLHQQTIAIIPFDSFIESGGDPLYMWPALATLDIEKGSYMD